MDGVPEEEVRRLLSIARRRQFSRNEVVFHREDPADSLHLVSEGRIAIRNMTPLGDTVTIGIRGPGERFGEMALVAEGRKRSETLEALEEAEMFAVYVAEFRLLRREHPSVNQVLIGFLAEELERQNELLLEALYPPVERRVLRRLAELSGLYAGRDSVTRSPRSSPPRWRAPRGDRQPGAPQGANAGKGGAAAGTNLRARRGGDCRRAR
jgi:CRP-like cAMP-binding protein